MNKSRKLKSIFIACVLGVCFCVAIGAAGGKQDPLITLSSLRTSYYDAVSARSDKRALDLKNAMNTLFQDKRGQALALANAGVSESELASIANSVLAQTGASSVHTVGLKRGDIVRGTLGSGFVMTDGSADIVGTELVNVSAGGSRTAGNYIARNIYYLIPQNDQSGIIITSDTATVQLRDGAVAITKPGEEYYNFASALAQMTLFKGTDKGYELSRAPTRLECLIMLIRLLGEEQAALEFTGSHNFTDITGWADANKYIAYAVSRGYTTGVSATEFAPNSQANAATFYTFVLRALGYSDKQGDFEWNVSDGAKLVEKGVMTQSELDNIQKGTFLRGHSAFVMYRALSAELKNSSVTLIKRLLENNVCSSAQYDSAKKIAG